MIVVLSVLVLCNFEKKKRKKYARALSEVSPAGLTQYVPSMSRSKGKSRAAGVERFRIFENILIGAEGADFFYQRAQLN